MLCQSRNSSTRPKGTKLCTLRDQVRFINFAKVLLLEALDQVFYIFVPKEKC
jgi:hypothetical protein